MKSHKFLCSFGFSRALYESIFKFHMFWFGKIQRLCHVMYPWWLAEKLYKTTQNVTRNMGTKAVYILKKIKDQYFIISTSKNKLNNYSNKYINTLIVKINYI